MRLPPSKWNKCNIPIPKNFHSCYRQIDECSFRHHQRLQRFIKECPDAIECPECKGACGWTEPVLDYGQGPWFACGLCEGLGKIHPKSIPDTQINKLIIK